ncbi:TRAP transporter small permease subunit [uncultured Roseibium sp.]|uniref:TRAP transporter small permease subunit n=1 Tax=uncultured Roseibium sp. TaxID=1936171 RepID=UPI002635724D|nr:TRAP transporter small permease subunit [uncultured Roseibium sp.]
MSLLHNMNRATKDLANACLWIAALLIGLAVFVVLVIARYGFNASQAALDELQWHFVGAAILFAIVSCIDEDSHVRIDNVYARFSNRLQRTT